MAAKWLVNQKDHQHAFDKLDELVALAKSGELVAGDLVQPPGASDWVYANEVPELKSLVQDNVSGMSDSSRMAMMLGLAGFFVLLILVGGATAGWAYLQLPDGTDTIIGGEKGLAWNQMVVTVADAPLRGAADGNAATVATLPKESVVEVLGKQNGLWQVKTAAGQEGFLALEAGLPIYQFGPTSVQEQYDPLYNPDKYVQIGNAAWNLAEKSETKTVFKFMVTNAARHKMTGLVLAAAVKDDKGTEIDRREFAVEGDIPAGGDVTGQTFVGVLLSDDKTAAPRVLTEATFLELAKTDPALQTKWSEGVEFEMKTKEFSAATIDIVKVQAVPGTFVSGEGEK